MLLFVVLLKIVLVKVYVIVDGTTISKHPPSSIIQCDPRLDAVITHALKPDRSQRQSSAAEFKAELHEALTR